MFIVAIIYTTIICYISFLLFEILGKTVFFSTDISLYKHKSWKFKISNFLIIVSTLPAIVFVSTFLLFIFQILDRPNDFILDRFYNCSCFIMTVGLVNFLCLSVAAFRSIKLKKQALFLLKQQAKAIVSLAILIFTLLFLKGR